MVANGEKNHKPRTPESATLETLNQEKRRQGGKKAIDYTLGFVAGFKFRVHMQ